MAYGFVQSKLGFLSSSAATLDITLNSTVTAGNRIIVFAAKAGALVSITGVSDDKGNTYTSLNDQADSFTEHQHIFTAQVVTGGTVKVTVTANMAGTFLTAVVMEYSGLSTASGTGSRDVQVSAAGLLTSNPATGNTPAVGAANELALACVTDSASGSTMNAPAGWTGRGNSFPDGTHVAMQVIEKDTPASSGAVVSASWTKNLTDSGNAWIASAIVFQLAGAGGAQTISPGTPSVAAAVPAASETASASLTASTPAAVSAGVTPQESPGAISLGAGTPAVATAPVAPTETAVASLGAATPSVATTGVAPSETVGGASLGASTASVVAAPVAPSEAASATLSPGTGAVASAGVTPSLGASGGANLGASSAAVATAPVAPSESAGAISLAAGSASVATAPVAPSEGATTNLSPSTGVVASAGVTPVLSPAGTSLAAATPAVAAAPVAPSEAASAPLAEGTAAIASGSSAAAWSGAGPVQLLSPGTPAVVVATSAPHYTSPADLACSWREVEGPLRAWLKAEPRISGLTASGRYVYFAAPDVKERPTSWMTFRRLGGAPQISDTPLDNALITFDCWGRTKGAASSLAEALVCAIQSIDRPTPMGTVVALNGQVVLWSFEPDAEIDVPRVVVDANILFRAA